MTSIRTALLMTAALAAHGLLAATAHAADPAGIRISYSDLDLSTPKGIDVLYGRIRRAADEYCNDVLSQTGSRIVRGQSACVADAVSNTVRVLKLPSLTALHVERTATASRG